METLGQTAAELLQQMGFEVGRLYPHVVRAVWARALGDLLVMIVVVGAAPFVIPKLFRWMRFPSLDEPDELIVPCMVAIVGAVAYVIALIIIMTAVGTTIATVIEPEGSAVIQVIKGMK